MGARETGRPDGPRGAPRWGGAPASLPHLLSGACPSVRPLGLRTAASEGPLGLPRDSRGRTEKGLDGAGGEARSRPPVAPPTAAAPPRPRPRGKARDGGRAEGVESANGSAGGVRSAQ